MDSTETLRHLLGLLRADGMRVSWCSVPVREVVYVKGVLEAYPGVAAVHAPPGRVLGERAPFAVATTPQFAALVDELLADLARDVGLALAEPPEAFAEPPVDL